MNNLVNMNVLTMSSVEIAELVGARHDNVKQSIERLVKREVIQLPTMAEVKNHLGQAVRMYQINKRDSLVVVAQLSPEFTGRVVDRWQELEAQQAPAIKAPTNYIEALQALIVAEQAKEVALLQIETQKPLVTYAETVTTAMSGVCIRDWVSSMKVSDGLKVGEKQVINYLLDNKYLYRNADSGKLKPYADKFDLFSVEPIIVARPTGNKGFMSLKITGLGQVMLTEKIVEFFTKY